MATLLLNRGQMNLVKNDIKHFYFYQFVLYGKIDMKYEISVSRTQNFIRSILFLAFYPPN